MLLSVSSKLYAIIQILMVQRRARYCSHCKNYVIGFDHHCPAFGNCIGKNSESSTSFSWILSSEFLIVHSIINFYGGLLLSLFRSQKSCSLYSAPGWIYCIWGILCRMCFSMWVQATLLPYLPFAIHIFMIEARISTHAIWIRI